MRNSAILFLIATLSLAAFAQKPKPAKKPAAAKTNLTKPATATPKNAEPEKEAFQKAVTIADAAERMAALDAFLSDFPQSKEKTRAQELIVSACAQIGDEKLRSGETESGVAFFKLAVAGAPKPVSDKFFSEILLQFPTNLFWRGERTAALEIARLIEEKAEGNAKQMLGLATVYLSVEDAVQARRLTDKALAIDANLPAAYQTLGLTHRLNFELEAAAAAYAKALELDAQSIVSKRSLAEMKRALGRPSEAATLYAEILAKDETDLLAQTGLILALFGAEKRAEAESRLTRSLEANEKNLPLLVGAAYWYAAHNEGARAIELANKAVALEPRYVWAHLALARGLLAEKRPLEAERVLLRARQYGSFPTLDYEIATARAAAGFYREAAEELRKNFVVKNDLIETKLGGRVTKEVKSFTELLALERRASIFEPVAADDAENANRLKSLLDFNQKLAANDASETEIARAADAFARGEDKMKLHRALYAANSLVQKKTALPKALEFTQAALGGADAALDVPNAASAVLADELYESRTRAISRNELVIVPEIPRQTLSAILRGRIEEITGWALYQQGKPAEATVRLKRAVSVLPEKSAWWRSSLWRLGAALEAEGKEKEALDTYVKSYPADAPDALKYSLIESLYVKVNGNRDGLEARIGAKPASAVFAAGETATSESVAQNIAQNTPPVTQTHAAEPRSEAEPKAEIKPEASPETVASLKVEASPQTKIPKEIPARSEPEQSVREELKSTPEIPADSKPAPNSTVDAPVKAQEELEQTGNIVKPQPTPEVTSDSASLPETEPVAEKVQISSVKTETAPAVVPSPEPARTTYEVVVTDPAETKIEKEAPKATENLGVKEEKSTDAPNPPFESVVITIPKSESSMTANAETKTIEPPKPESKPEETVSASEKPVDENISAGINRMRVVVEDKLAPTEIPPCSLTASQENISLLNGGGSLGLSVGFKDARNSSEIKAVSNSPGDVEIVVEPEIGALSGRAFFLIKSISTNKGMFQVNFEAPCGKKTISVRVR